MENIFPLTALLLSGRTRASTSHSDLPSDQEVKTRLQHSDKTQPFKQDDRPSSGRGQKRTWSLLGEHYPGLGRQVGAGDHQLLAAVGGAAGRAEALHQGELLPRALG